MSTVEVILDAHKLLGYASIPDYAEAALGDVLGSYISRITRRAKILHRFRSRTGNLVSAIESEMYGLSGRVYIDDMLAPYGKFVHNGQRTWAPDPFIYDAVAELEDELSIALKATLAKEFAKVETEQVPVSTPGPRIVYTIEPAKVKPTITPAEKVIDKTVTLEIEKVVDKEIQKEIEKKIEKELDMTVTKIIDGLPDTITQEVLDKAISNASSDTIHTVLDRAKMKLATKTLTRAANKPNNYNSMAMLLAFLINEEDAQRAKEEQAKRIKQLKYQEMYQ